MDKRADYLIQVLGQIGSPLMSAIVDASSATDPEADAKTMAELLSKTVELGISMADMADLSSVQNDSVRVALTGLASPLIGQLHTKSKQTPSENDLKRIASALQAVLTFSENFTPDEDNTERLKNLESNGAGGDAHQITVQYMQAFLPAVNAIAAFPFGQPEQKLIMDVSSKLTAQATNLRNTLLGDLPQAQQEAVDLAILKSLVALYAACHDAETARLSAANSDEQDSNAALESLWRNFDTRTAMLEALARGLLPGSDGAENTPAAPAATTETPATEAPAAASEPAQEPAEKPAAPAEKSPPPAGVNPMSMFAKPKAEAEAPAATPAEAPPEQTPATTETASEDDSASESGGESSGGGPMSFFKKAD